MSKHPQSEILGIIRKKNCTAPSLSPPNVSTLAYKLRDCKVISSLTDNSLVNLCHTDNFKSQYCIESTFKSTIHFLRCVLLLSMYLLPWWVYRVSVINSESTSLWKLFHLYLYVICFRVCTGEFWSAILWAKKLDY